jgi:preprotein translocase subunit SecG
MGLSGLACVVQGWVVGSEGFSGTHSILIVVTWVLSVAWMIWLVVVAWRMQDTDARARAADSHTP